MAGEWTQARLQDHADLMVGFAFKSALFRTRPPGIRLARGDNVTEGQFRWGQKTRYWPEINDELRRYLLREGDVLVGMDGSKVGRNWATVRDKDLPCLLVQRVACLRARSTLDQGFLALLVGSELFRQYMNAVRTGSSIPHISGSQIGAFSFALPTLSEQRIIAYILGTLDDKIELNRRINETLEAITGAMFKAWFVEFEPVRSKVEGRESGLPKPVADLFPDTFVDSEFGEIPAGWRIGGLDEISSVTMGLSPDGESYNADGIGTPLINGPVEFGDYFPVKTKWTTSPTRISQIGDLVFCVRGSTTGRRVVADDAYCLGRGVCAIRAKNDARTFLYQTVNTSLDRLLSKTTGSVFPNLSAPDISGFPIVIPKHEVVHAFQSLAEPLTVRVEANVNESRTLVTLRDTLLPKLMSGEIRVESAERIIEAA